MPLWWKSTLLLTPYEPHIGQMYTVSYIYANSLQFLRRIAERRGDFFREAVHQALGDAGVDTENEAVVYSATFTPTDRSAPLHIEEPFIDSVRESQTSVHSVAAADRDAACRKDVPAPDLHRFLYGSALGPLELPSFSLQSAEYEPLPCAHSYFIVMSML